MRSLVLLSLLFAGCQGKDANKAQPAQPAPTPTPAVESLPPMPSFPSPARGRLAAQSAGGPAEIKGEWAAEAGVCEQPPMLQVVAQVEGTGTIVLLALPEKNRVTDYPVTTVGNGLPTPPAAQVGVQVFRKQGPAAYQASEGSVEIYAYEKTVSGRFGVTMRQISSNERIRYAGAFREIPIKQLDKSYCTVADSAARARPHP